MNTVKNKKPKVIRRSFIGNRIVYCCPKCGMKLSFSKKIFHDVCEKCGQYLDWGGYDRMPAVWIEAKDSGEAGYWAEKYESVTGEVFGIDIEAFRLTRREYPVRLYFPFKNPKEYGRFSRLVAKETREEHLHK